jgi:hypothetical protein
MTLATILVIYFLSLASGPNPALQDQTAPQAQASPASNTSAPASSASSSSASQQSPAQLSPKPKPTRPKKVKTSNCATSSPDAKSPDGKEAPAANSAQASPCPPQKKIVKDGGTAEPTVQLKSDTKNTPDQVSTTEQLRTAAEDNLKKIAGRQLSASQQQTVDQIKLFMDQSKAAVAEGDVERGHNLAMKARLLSDELVNP